MEHTLNDVPKHTQNVKNTKQLNISINMNGNYWIDAKHLDVLTRKEMYECKCKGERLFNPKWLNVRIEAS